VEATIARLGCREYPGELPGDAQAIRAALANEPLLIAAALVAVYIVLGVALRELHPPAHDLSTLPSAGWGDSSRCLICREELSCESR